LSGAFLLHSKKLINSEKVKSLFSENGFNNVLQFEYGDTVLWHAEKLQVNTFAYSHYKLGDDAIHIFGTCCYKNYSINNIAKELLIDFIHNKIDKKAIKGSYGIIISHNKKLFLLRDPSRIYQLYSGENGSIISSSFYITSKLALSLSVNENAFLSNLICGFCPTPHTLLNEIERPLSFSNTFITQYDTTYLIENISSNLSFKDHVKTQGDKLVGYFDSIQHFTSSQNIELGLSGGFDSRLILAAAKKYNSKFHTHTHYKKNDQDPVIAQKIAEASSITCDMPIYPSTKEIPNEELSKLVDESFHYFDARICSMMQYFKYEYTYQYRVTNFKNIQLILSGVGGEIYRNDNLLKKTGTMNTDTWIKRYLIGAIGIKILPEEKLSALIQYLKTYISTILQKDITKDITYYDCKRFYIECWMPDWHGLRNSAENKAYFHLSPYTDYEISRFSLNSIHHHGYCGEMEAAIINYISPQLANIPSIYGYSFIHIPFKAKVNEWIRINTPLFIRKLVSKRKSKKSSLQYLLEKESISSAFNSVEKQFPSLNLEPTLYHQEIFNTLISLGYILKRIYEKEHN
jgi:hypothetical protein